MIIHGFGSPAQNQHLNRRTRASALYDTVFNGITNPNVLSRVNNPVSGRLLSRFILFLNS